MLVSIRNEYVKDRTGQNPSALNGAGMTKKNKNKQKIGTHVVHVCSAVHALRTCLFTALTHSLLYAGRHSG